MVNRSPSILARVSLLSPRRMDGLVVNRSGKRIGVRHPPSQPVQESALLHSETTAPGAHWERLSAVGQKMVVSLVRSLLQRRGPATILRRVGSIIVHALDLVPRGGSLAHVPQEGFKGTVPAVANPDATAPIARVTAVPRVCAPLPHHLPDRELRSAGRAVGPNLLTLKAPTGLGNATAQRIAEDRSLGAAITPAQPARLLARSILRPAKHQEPGEAFASQVHEGRHAVFYNAALTMGGGEA
jgi:hypothetical protein